MVEELQSLKDPPKFDLSKLHLYPDPLGMQHDEVLAQRDRKPSWLPKFFWVKWKISPRKEAAGAPTHPSVLERYKAAQVLQCDCLGEYRPDNMTIDPLYKCYYEPKAGEEIIGTDKQ